MSIIVIFAVLLIIISGIFAINYIAKSGGTEKPSPDKKDERPVKKEPEHTTEKIAEYSGKNDSAGTQKNPPRQDNPYK